MGYIYETHLHTIEGSACGHVYGKDYITIMKDRGYSGIIVTDHFFNGNSAVPRELSCSRHELYRLVHASGGLMIQAHPYRERDYISAIHLAPHDCDGAEIYNSGNAPYMNALALRYAQNHRLRYSAGSDIHRAEQKIMGGMCFPHPLRSIQDFIHSFFNNKGVAVSRREDGSFVPVSDLPEECHTDIAPTLPVRLHE